jgi:hypothetical protein
MGMVGRDSEKKWSKVETFGMEFLHDLLVHCTTQLSARRIRHGKMREWTSGE